MAATGTLSVCQEELPNVRGQGQKLGGPYARRAAAKRSYPTSEGRGSIPRVPGCDGTGMAERSYPVSEARGCGMEEPPDIQGSVAVWAQEGLEEPSHVEGQEGQQ